VDLIMHEGGNKLVSVLRYLHTHAWMHAHNNKL